MAITYGFFNSVNGDRKYTAEDIGRYLHGIVSSGVYADTSTSLQVLAGDGMQVMVQPGRAMLDYHFMENDSPMPITLSPGSTQARIDAIVARLITGSRLCDIVVKEGTPAAAPVAPTMERTDEIKEYMLAAVYVERLATVITQENITDTRPDNAVCGWVHALIQQVDTSTLHAQYEEAYARKMAELDEYIEGKKTEIDAKLDTVDSVLNSNDVAGVPIPSASNAGQIPTVNRFGSRYVLQHPTVRQTTIPSSDGLNLSDITEDDVGLHLYTAASSIAVKCRKSADTTEQIGTMLSTSLCYVNYSTMLGGTSVNYAIVGKTITLIDITGGKTYTATVKWDTNGTETNWASSKKARFVSTVNNTDPNGDGNVSV